MSGQLPRRTRVYDNAAEFACDIPTYAHHLRRAGYQTLPRRQDAFRRPGPVPRLRGAADHRHLPGRFRLDAGLPPARASASTGGITIWAAVKGAGVAEITNQLEYDDEVAYHATRKVYDAGRGLDARPWMLTVSFTHPHDPYVARRKYWDLYEDCAHLDPGGPAIPYEAQDAHSRRILDASDWRNFAISEDDIRRSRRAYFANISYVDEKIGEVLAALTATRQAENTIIVFLSDHGDMLGERGLWFKMTFFEGSVRVPLMIAAPGLPPGRIDAPVSTLDVLPTLSELAGIDLAEIVALDRWRDADAAHAGARARRAGAHGICRRRICGAAGRAARRRVEIRPLRAGPALAVRPRRRPA